MGAPLLNDERPFSLSPARRSPAVGARSAGVIMTKAGSKGGNLREKLDGNELDLSLSDLNEVPVKELVSIAPQGPGAYYAWHWPLRGPPPFSSLSFPSLKRSGGGMLSARWVAASGPSVSGMYTCHFGAVPEDREDLPVRPWAFSGPRVNLSPSWGLSQRPVTCRTPGRSGHGVAGCISE